MELMKYLHVSMHQLYDHFTSRFILAKHTSIIVVGFLDRQSYTTHYGGYSTNFDNHLLGLNIHYSILSLG